MQQQLKTPYRTRISGCGSYLPKKIVSNKDFESMVETSDEWITERTGIKERRMAAEDENLSDMALEASKSALSDGNLEASDIDMIIFATTFSEQAMPSTACILQKKLEKLGGRRVMAFDMSAACTGFVYALGVADQFVRSGMYQNILVVGGEILTPHLDYNDRSSCILFGDGVGAFIASRAEEKDQNTILGASFHADGTLGHLLQVPNSRPRTHFKTFETMPVDYMKMNGREIFKHAVRTMCEGALETLKNCQMSLDDVDWMIPHQANQRILEAVGKKLGLDKSKVISTVSHTANTSAGTVPIAFDLAYRDGRLKRGQNILITAFGGGFTSGGLILKF